LEKGLKCYLTNHESTFNENLNQINLLTKSLENRIKALLLNSNVEALIIIVQNSEFLYKVFPLDKVDKINLVSKEIEDLKTNKNLDEKNFKLLINKFS
jgi:cyanophycin synthetase